MRLWLLTASTLAFAASADASGHGPVFGLATPTNGRGDWTLDFSAMGRAGSPDIGSMIRAMLTYGITQDVQISVSAPEVFTSVPLAPAQITGMMPASGDFEALGAWRFQRSEPSVGTRFESTAYIGILIPGPQNGARVLNGLKSGPGVYTAIATGFASRVNYFWAGVGNTHYAGKGGDERPNDFSYSLVYGFRPPAGRKEYPHLDWRVFAEMTGDHLGKSRRAGREMPGTGGNEVFLGPAALFIYKNYGLEGGIQFPVFRDVGRVYEREKYRFAVDFSYFF